MESPRKTCPMSGDDSNLATQCRAAIHSSQIDAFDAQYNTSLAYPKTEDVHTDLSSTWQGLSRGAIETFPRICDLLKPEPVKCYNALRKTLSRMHLSEVPFKRLRAIGKEIIGDHAIAFKKGPWFFCTTSSSPAEKLSRHPCFSGELFR